jgi:hypothetical protein
MRWIVLVPVALAALAPACGGPKVPTHSGYKTETAKPWKKPKVLAFDEKAEAKADGDLAYRDYRRARWFAVDLPANGELTIKLEITPPGDSVNEEFDLAMEVLDPGFRVIAKSDLEESDAYELAKSRELVDLVPGRYLIHLYLQGRMDSAEYSLRVGYKRTAPAEVKTTFPSEVEFLQPLALVPPKDDTPVTYKPPTTVVRTTRTVRPPKPPVAATPKADPITARIIGVLIIDNKTQITIARGTASGASDGMKGSLKSFSFTLSGCNERRCSALLTATPDQVRAAGSTVTLAP